MDEFSLIRRYFQRADTTPAVKLGMGDDAALLALPAGEVLAVTTDTLVAGRHFPLDTPAHAIGWKALAVNLSDLAAMGAKPLAVTLALTLPQADEDWLSAFSTGFFALANAQQVPLIGGDTTRGPLSITVTALGAVPQALAICRSGARVGDHVFVSGSIGDAGLGLALARHTTGLQQLSAEDQQFALARLQYPTPRLALGQALRGIATAMLDVSDGLLQDLGHILNASDVGADLVLDALPLSAPLRALASEPNGHAQVLRWALSAGDDYELLFTVAPSHLLRVEALAQTYNLALTDIGVIRRDRGLRMHSQGAPWHADNLQGYDHFSSSDHD